jgi:dTMP kinase
MINSNSVLISIEGIEGCGKSSLIEQLKQKLPVLYPQKTFHFFREPGATPWGEKVRALLLDAQLERSTLSEVFLFISARAELNQQCIKPLLEKSDQVIILDRYFDSTYAYQGFVQGIDLNYLKSLHQTPGLNLVPKKTLYLKISAQTSLMRQQIRNQTKDYFEQWGLDKIQKLVSGFDTLAKDSPQRFSIIDAELSMDKVLEDSLNSLKGVIG